MSAVPMPLRLSPHRGLLLCAVVVVALKVIGLMLDPTMRLFLGDSGTYFHTALTGWTPPDRSFLYGRLIGATAIPAGSAHVLVLLQTGFGVLSALLLYSWLAFGMRVSAGIAVAAAALFALEPAQMLYERMMMAEATGFLCFAMFFVALTAHVASGRWFWIFAYAGFGVLAVALRISLLPVVLVLSLIAPLVPLLAPVPTRGRLHFGVRVGLGFLLALAATLVAHQQYQRVYGRLAQSAPAYTQLAGVFRLALVAPLVRPAHFENSGVPATALDEVTIDTRDPRQREAQIWTPGGLYDVLSRHTDDPDRAARKISIKAARGDPLGLVRLGLATTADYFDPEVFAHRLQDDLGRRGPNDGLVSDLERHLDYVAGDVHVSDTAASVWFAWGSRWLAASLLLLAPLALVTLWLGWRLPRRELRVLLALASVGLVFGHVLFSHIVSFRYLHPLPWFVLANLALLLDAIRARAAFRAGTPSSASSHS